MIKISLHRHRRFLFDHILVVDLRRGGRKPHEFKTKRILLGIGKEYGWCGEVGWRGKHFRRYIYNTN